MTELNLEKARFNMINQQIRPWEVLDERVLETLAEVPREQFVPETYRRIAFVDTKIPLDHDQVMLEPRVEARVLQALDLRSGDRALEIGTGSGYLTACLATLAGHVESVDIFEEFTTSARKKLDARGIDNVTLRTGDAANGWACQGTFDAIAITGALPLMPEEYKRLLNEGGRLVAFVGPSPARQALLITRTGPESWSTETLFETDLPELINAPRPQAFVF